MSLTTRAIKFSASALEREIAAAAEAKWRDVPAQVRYLAAYLADSKAKAKTMLVESPYVDRHYLQEYIGFYGTQLRPPRSNTTRIHFWRRSFDDAGWKALLHQAAAEDVARASGAATSASIEKELERDYLGYIVVRPVAACPIGRTVLRTYREQPSRCYAPAATTHDVHLQGLTLRLSALPFQQQDQGLGACATTALWSSLARAMRADGGRAVTPLDVARAAAGTTGQLIAAPNGLDLERMLRTIRSLGYVPHVLSPTDHAMFFLALKAYVRAGIAVVLRLRVEPEGEVHAVAVAGIRESDDERQAEDLVIEVGTNQVRSTGLTRLYLHDDRLGPYARFVIQWPTPAELKKAAKGNWSPPLRLRFDPQKNGFDEYKSPLRVMDAIVPLYPKVRTSAEGLIAYAGDYLPIVRRLAGEQRDQLRLEPFMSLGGQYLAKLAEVLRDPARLASIRGQALFSRYVGVARFYLPDGWLCDLVVDTTDVKRVRGDGAPLLLAVGRDAGTITTFESVRELLGPTLLVA